jgi:hypothetical protein
MMEKAERFAPGAGKKHREKADAEYAAAKVAGNAERDQTVGGGPGSPVTPTAVDAPGPGDS